MVATSSPKKDFAVAIVGGGVCGLALAIALTKGGVPVQLFEAATKFEQVGAGLGFGPNATRVLDSMGVLRALLKRVTGGTHLNLEPVLFVSGMEGHEVTCDYSLTSDEPGLGLHRPDYLDALVPLLDPGIAHFNKRCTSVSVPPDNSSPSIIHFSDGTTHEADIVIGADGIKSVVRNAVVGPEINRLAFSNTLTHRALIPIEDAKAAGVKESLLTRAYGFTGKDRHIILYPVKINGNVSMNLAAFSADHDASLGSVALPPDQPWVTAISQQELCQLYEGWSSDITALLKCAPTVTKWSIHVVNPPLETYAKGYVAVVGDAAHAMLPHLGAGAGQGIEDVYVLSQLLGHSQTTRENIEAVLQAYDRVRRPRSQLVATRSYEAGRVYEGHGKLGDTVEGMREELKNQWAVVWDHDLDADVQSAISWLQETAAFRPTVHGEF